MRIPDRYERQNQRSKKLIEGGDTWATVAYYCLLKLHIMPHEFMSLPENEQAFIVASILVKTKADKKEAEEMKRKARAGRRK